jgi:hypothetical protein
LTFQSSQQRVAVNAARSDLPTPRARARALGVAAGAGASGAQEGAKDPAAGELGTEGRRIPVARAAGTLSPGDLKVTSSGEGEEEESDGGQTPSERWEPAPPHQEPRRRQRSKCLGRTQKRPTPGGLRKRWRTPWRRRRAPQRRMGARQWRHRLPPRRPLSPRGRGSGASPP